MPTNQNLFSKPKHRILMGSTRNLVSLLAIVAILAAGMSVGEAQFTDSYFTTGYFASSNVLPTVAPSNPIWRAASGDSLSGTGSSELLKFSNDQGGLLEPGPATAPGYDPTQPNSTVQFGLSVDTPGTVTGSVKYSDSFIFDTAAAANNSANNIAIELGIGTASGSAATNNTLTLQTSTGVQLASITSSALTPFDLSQLNTYRLTFASTGIGSVPTTVVNLYLNNALILTASQTGAEGGAALSQDPIIIGESGIDSSTATSSLSYLEWTNAAAVAAAPEPKTVASILMGVSMLIFVMRVRAKA